MVNNITKQQLIKTLSKNQYKTLATANNTFYQQTITILSNDQYNSLETSNEKQ